MSTATSYLTAEIDREMGNLRVCTRKLKEAMDDMERDRERLEGDNSRDSAIGIYLNGSRDIETATANLREKARELEHLRWHRKCIEDSERKEGAAA